MKRNLDYEAWKGLYMSFVRATAEELMEEELGRLGLTLTYGEMKNSKGHRVREKKGSIDVRIDFDRLYGEMRDLRLLHMDDCSDGAWLSIEKEGRIGFATQVAYGIIEHLRSLKLGGNLQEVMPNVHEVLNASEEKIDCICEEFGEFQFPDATEVTFSLLEDAIEEVLDRKTTLGLYGKT